ncbi:sulfotransferase family protein [Devosia sp.]|uniref:sulfotransferase family protein n=1 Tax=Devosia sp. TaxID=1871048 RepID=UPI0026233733|nr:sulfotransferase family protein [Devosia sp.]
MGIVVLGMHRSGTSAITRVLSLLGAALPERLLGSNRGNSEGHWEPVEIVRLNGRALGEVGRRWFDWRRVRRPIASEFVPALVQLLGLEYGDAPRFVLKDPRVCLLVPAYHQAFSDMGVDPYYLLVLRDPLAVSASLHERDKLGKEYVLLLWLRYMLEAERSSRGARRSFVHYEAMLVDWKSSLSEVVASTGLELPSDTSEVDSFLNPSHQHHAFEVDHLPSEGALANWVSTAYSALSRLVTAAGDAAALAELDELYLRFNEATDAIGDPMFAEIRRLQEALTEARAKAPLG